MGIMETLEAMKKADKGRIEGNEESWKEGPAIKVTRNEISKTTPLKCSLIVELNNQIANPRKINLMFNDVMRQFSTLNDNVDIQSIENGFKVSIVSGFRRCSFCNSFRNRLKEDAKVIELGRCSGFKTRGGFITETPTFLS